MNIRSSVILLVLLPIILPLALFITLFITIYAVSCIGYIRERGAVRHLYELNDDNKHYMYMHIPTYNITIRYEHIVYQPNDVTIVYFNGTATSMSGSTNIIRDNIKGCTTPYNYVHFEMMGYGDSTDSPQISVYDNKTIADIIHTFLQQLNVTRFIAVGGSYGGQTAEFYRLTYPDDVIGCLLIDPLPPSVLEKTSPVSKMMSYAPTVYYISSLMARMGVMRLLVPIMIRNMPELQSMTDQFKREFMTEKHLLAMRREFAGMPIGCKQLQQLHQSLIDKPNHTLLHQPLVIMSALHWTQLYGKVTEEQMRVWWQTAQAAYQKHSQQCTYVPFNELDHGALCTNGTLHAPYIQQIIMQCTV